MQVEFYLAGEINQVIDSIPWVRCASGNVFYVSFINTFVQSNLLGPIQQQTATTQTLLEIIL